MSTDCPTSTQAWTSRRVAARRLVPILVAITSLTGCTIEASRSPEAPVSSPAASASVAVTPTPTPGPAFARNPAPIVEGELYVQSIVPADFVVGISHPFFPLTPGTRFTFDGDEHVEVTVLAETKLILGVAATVVRDQVFVEGTLEEDTLDYYAQDRDGNVWYFGEETAELKDGKVTSTAGSWESGVDGGQPGIIMLAVPEVGDSYRQEYLKGEAEDLAEVTALSGSITVPAGSWSGADVLVTEEWTPLEPDVREQKTYARGVGLVDTRRIKGGQETTRLTEISEVTARADTGARRAGEAVRLAALMSAFRVRRARSWRTSAGVRSRHLPTLTHARGPRCRGSFEERCCRRAGRATRSR